MRWGLFILVALFAIGGAAAASATPPTRLVDFGVVAHARPVAGQSFTGLTVTPLGGTIVSSMSCDASLGRKTLHGHVLRYYGLSGVSALTCSWKIPASSHGTLRLDQATVVTSLEQSVSGGHAAWRVKS